MEKVLGLDLGTNSIGWAIVQHNDDLSYTLLDKGVNIFQDGVAHDKSGEKPMVTERTAARSSRRHYFRRRLRKIELLRVLVKSGLCPYLSDEDLLEWKNHKIYPLKEDFLDWQRTDDGSNKNPYHNRYICLTQKLDISVMSDRYILGRALYHIVQRRGFLSNRKETTKDTDGKVKDSIKSLTKAMQDSGCAYLGEYFYKLYEEGGKIRKNYTDRLEHYKKEFVAICERQNLDIELRKALENAIFYQRPLKSQKGQVGHCTFEKNKTRCPISHPRYEEFRMWCFINNIKVKTWKDDDYRSLNSNEVEQIIPLFFRKTKNQFDFEDIAKKIAGKGNYCDKTDKSEKPYRFNYKMFTSVSGCPVSAGLRSIYGEDWLNQICGVYSLGEGKTPDQILNDIWHVLFSFDDEEKLKEWAKVKLQMSSEEADAFEKISVPQGYASLSLNAINKILPYLRKGYRYDEAVIMANLPAVMGCDAERLPDEVAENVAIIMEDNISNPLEKKKSIHQSVTEYLRDCHNVDCKRIEKLYHPSMIDTYQAALPVDGIYKLGSPRTSSVRNPMAMRALFRLRNLLNELLRDGKIDSDTLVRIEFSRWLNDSNIRKAIETYQREMKRIHDDYSAKIKEQMGDDYVPSDDEVLKYQLWEEQKHKCPYTNQEIGLSDFLGPDPKYDIEHTVPRSRGGDNSQMNKTLCESRFNRDIKKDSLPSELTNHSEIMAIVDGFGWQEEIDSLRKRLERTRGYSATKEEKDRKIQDRHYLKMKLDYLEGKLKRFAMTEVPEGFSNRQGVDIGIIGRYARMYLQTVFKRVSTVKGATTAAFRKMWGLQDYYSKKERVSHAHHCVDAITIACIGRNEYDRWAQYMRDEERYRLSAADRPHFPKPWETFTEDVLSVSDSILVPHYTPSNLSKHTKKRLRVRGKLQYGPNGEKLYVQGDTARCSLHEQTFYGAIKRDDEIKYVVRKSLDSLKLADVENIVDDVVREKVKTAIAEKGFKKAVSDTIWMNEELQIPIKKVRIFTGVKNPIRLKAHRDKSVHKHKRCLHVKNDGNYCMAIYEGNNDRGKIIRSYKLVNNLDAVNYFNGKTGLDNIVPYSDDKDLPLKCILKTGTMVLFYEKSPKELYECGVEELSKRLYKVIVMNKDGRVAFKYHLEARNDEKIKEDFWKEFKSEPPKLLTKGYSSINFVEPYPKLLLSKDNFNMMVEGYHFNITSAGKIIFKNVLW